jgi:hypothetical protein
MNKNIKRIINHFDTLKAEVTFIEKLSDTQYVVYVNHNCYYVTLKTRGVTIKLHIPTA